MSFALRSGPFANESPHGAGARLVRSSAFISNGCMKVLLVLFFVTALFGQTPSATVRASGEVTISAQPDRAQVSIGVVTESAAADDASARNAATTAEVIKAIKQVIGSRGELKTSQYSVTPTYDYSNHASPKITGYQANNTVLVTIDDLSLVGKVLDSASAAGSNRIMGIQFTLRDDTAMRAQALAEAAAKARSNGEAIAKALNLRVIGVTQAESSSVFPRPLPMPMARMSMGTAQVATPIESETAVDVHASVTVTLAVAPHE